MSVIQLQAAEQIVMNCHKNSHLNKNLFGLFRFSGMFSVNSLWSRQMTHMMRSVKFHPGNVSKIVHPSLVTNAIVLFTVSVQKVKIALGQINSPKNKQ